VLGTGRFDFAAARQTKEAMPNSSLSGRWLPDNACTQPAAWRARRPLHPTRFKRLIESDLPGVIRAKGFFWLATRMAWAGEWHLAGRIGRHEGAGFWWAAQPEFRWPDDAEWRAGIAQHWQEPWGDRRQEIVLIGVGMDEASLRLDLDACLLTDAEMKGGANAWARLPDPFPAWREG